MDDLKIATETNSTDNSPNDAVELSGPNDYDVVHALDRAWAKEVGHEAEAALVGLKRAQLWASVTAGGFLLVGAGLLVYLMYNIARYGGSIESILASRARAEGSTRAMLSLLQALIAVSWPALLVLGLAMGCVLFAMRLYRTSEHVLESSLQSLGRFRREAAVGITRYRVPRGAEEGTLRSARKALTWSVWMNRTLFLMGVALLVVGLGEALITNRADSLTVFLGVAAVLLLVVGTFTSPSRTLGPVLARIAELQTILAGYSREAQLIEEHVYQTIEHARAIHDPLWAQEAVERGVSQLGSLRARTAESIRHSTQPNLGKAEGQGIGFLELFGARDPSTAQTQRPRSN